MSPAIKIETSLLPGKSLSFNQKVAHFCNRIHMTKMLASWVVYLCKHSPELRPTRVFLPERFTNVCSFGVTALPCSNLSPCIHSHDHIDVFGYTMYESENTIYITCIIPHMPYVK